MLAVEASPHRLRRPDKSMENIRGVRGTYVKADNHTNSIYSSCFSECGSWVIERRVRAIAQQKTVAIACRVGVYASYLVPNVSPSSKRERRAWKINRSVLAPEQQVSEALPATARSRVITDDCTKQAYSAGTAATCSRGIEAGEDALPGQYKAVQSCRTIARSIATVSP